MLKRPVFSKPQRVKDREVYYQASLEPLAHMKSNSNCASCGLDRYVEGLNDARTKLTGPVQHPAKNFDSRS